MDYLSALLHVVLLFGSLTGGTIATVPEVFYFNGYDMITYDVPDGQHTDPTSLHISFRARPQRNTGVVFYSVSENGEIFVLEYHDNSFYQRFSFASPQSGSGVTGSASGIGLNEEEEWKNVTFTVNDAGIELDMNLVTSSSPSTTAVRLGKKVYIGGFPPDPKGTESNVFFQGCLEDFTLNGVNILKQYDGQRGVTDARFPHECPMVTSYMTFDGKDSYLRIPKEKSTTNELTSISFEFRTFDIEASLIRMEMGVTNVSVEFLNNNTLRLVTSSSGFEFDNTYPLGFDVGDGEYHRIEATIDEDGLLVLLDDYRKLDKQMTKPKGEDVDAYYLGGYPGVGYLGCIKILRINGLRFEVKELQEENIENVLFEQCKLLDRCYTTTSRCSHGGKCLRSREDFTCNCTGTGYQGPSCHTPMYPASCDQVPFPTTSDEVTTEIDIDGTGPLLPSQVICSKDSQTGKIRTIVKSNSSESATPVDGYQEPGSFRGVISYDIELPEVVGIADRAETCLQYIKYSCQNSRLMIVPESSSAPYGYWLDRNRRPRYYWGGAVFDSKKCECANTQNGCLVGLNCNCDAGETYETFDQGYFSNKTLLPVREVRLGDTGTETDAKMGNFLVGNLECTGDIRRAQPVTIQKFGSYLPLRKRLYNAPIDISFEFKTTIGKAQLFHASGYRAHYLSILLEDPRHIVISTRFSDDEVSKTISFSSDLNDDNWHSVYFELTYKHSIFKVDDKSVVLWESNHWEFYTYLRAQNLILGGNSNGTYGFVGCYQNFALNGEYINLQDLVKDGSTDIMKGCQGRCSSMSACQNGGTCTEYYATYMCDCSSTAFTGCYCGDAVGVRFPVGSWMSFDLQQRLQGSFQFLQIHFKSTQAKGVLAHITDSTGSRLVTVEINLRGGVDITYDSGDGGQGLFTSVDGLTDGQAHRITVRVTNSQAVSKATWDVEVDSDVQTSTDGPFTALPDTLYLASRSSISGSGGFDGCIFGVMYNTAPLLKEIKLTPTPTWVSFDQNAVKLDENDCGEGENGVSSGNLTVGSSQDYDSPRVPVVITEFGSQSMGSTQSPVVVSHFTDLTCNSTGIPKPSYLFRSKSGGLKCPHLVNGDQMLLPPDQRVEGTFQCETANDWGRTKSEFVQVQTAKIGKVTSVMEDSVFTTEGRYLRLRCNVSIESVPGAITEWEGADLMDNTAERLYQSVDGDLHLLWVLPEDSKVFTCFKVNPVLGTRVEVKRIQVQVTSVPDPSTYQNRPAELVYSSSVQQWADIGQTVTLECLVAAFPAPTVTWDLGGSADNSSAVTENRGRRLVIREYMFDMAGEYSCLIGNVVMTTVTLNQSMKPSWSMYTDPITVYEGSDVSLSCKPHTMSSVQWFINCDPFQLKPDYAVDGENLTITGAKRERDIFAYQCLTSNQYGLAYHSSYLNVISKTVVDTIRDDVMSMAGRTAVLEVNVQADKSSNIIFHWYKGESTTPLSQSNYFTILSTNKSSTLRVFTHSLKTEAQVRKYADVYRCVVMDAVSSQSVSGTISFRSSDGGSETGDNGSSITVKGNLGVCLVLLLGVLLIDKQFLSCN